MKKILFIALALGFLFFGVGAYLQSKPSPKSERIYKIVKQYSPYYLEKRFGGLQIRNKENKDFKEKPDNMEVFHRLESLEKGWGKQHLSIEKKTLSIQDNNGAVIKTVTLKDTNEMDFVRSYYGLQGAAK